ncbi:MAG: hypothetical protein QOI13_114 [Paraburkholderia sp.]|jgi:hypothetical protein|nr:hypothetical protein [Paraburkholderia sp.]
MTNDRHNPVRRTPLAALLIVLAAIILFAVVAYAYASPYLALDRLKRAADARDAETVNQYVDYPALRMSLKQQLTELLARRIDTQKREHPFAALGALIGMALIGPVVDNYATPDGVAALLNGMPPRGEPGEAPPISSTSSSGQLGSAPPPPPEGSAAGVPGETAPAPRQTSAGYRGIDEFGVTYRHDAASPPYSVILHRAGWFSWRLAAVDLNQQ